MILHKETAGFPLFAVREIKFLKSLRHKNIVKLKDVVSSKGCENKDPIVKHEFSRNVSEPGKQQQSNEQTEEDGYDILKLCGNLYFVFEFVDHDLGGLVDSKYKFSQREIKCIMKQLLEVLDYLQDLKVVHRDIKSSNILISNRHQVKLADFGLARSLQGADGREVRLDLSNNVITLWYRPPELLLGAVRYSTSIDIWSTGCVLAELELGRPFFPGKTEIEQLEIIFRTIGSPSEETWPGLSSLPHYETMIQNAVKYANTMEQAYAGKISEIGIQLLERMLMPDPNKRNSAKVLLSHRYFHTFPYAPNDPTELEPLAITQGQSFHEYKTKLLRKQKENELKQQKQDTSCSTQDTILDTNYLNIDVSSGGIASSSASTAATLPPTVTGLYHSGIAASSVAASSEFPVAVSSSGYTQNAIVPSTLARTHPPSSNSYQFPRPSLPPPRPVQHLQPPPPPLPVSLPPPPATQQPLQYQPPAPPQSQPYQHLPSQYGPSHGYYPAGTSQPVAAPGSEGSHYGPSSHTPAHRPPFPPPLPPASHHAYSNSSHNQHKKRSYDEHSKGTSNRHHDNYHRYRK